MVLPLDGYLRPCWLERWFCDCEPRGGFTGWEDAMVLDLESKLSVASIQICNPRVSGWWVVHLRGSSW